MEYPSLIILNNIPTTILLLVAFCDKYHLIALSVETCESVLLYKFAVS